MQIIGEIPYKRLEEATLQQIEAYTRRRNNVSILLDTDRHVLILVV